MDRVYRIQEPDGTWHGTGLNRRKRFGKTWQTLGYLARHIARSRPSRGAVVVEYELKEVSRKPLAELEPPHKCRCCGGKTWVEPNFQRPTLCNGHGIA